MNPRHQSVLLIVVGGALGSIAVDGRYLYYLKPVMFVPLLVAAAVFVAVGLAELLARPCTGDDISSAGGEACTRDVISSAGGHGHSHTRAGWLLVLPVLAIGFVAPPALGSWAAARDSGTVTQPNSSDFPPLPAGDPAPVGLGEYGVRAVWDDGRTLMGRTVALTGFVSPRREGGWYLTRMTLSCCAADARATKVEVRGVDAPASDSWVRVTGRYVPSGTTDPAVAVPALAADEIEPVDEPANPYE